MKIKKLQLINEYLHKIAMNSIDLCYANQNQNNRIKQCNKIQKDISTIRVIMHQMIDEIEQDLEKGGE